MKSRTHKDTTSQYNPFDLSLKQASLHPLLKFFISFLEKPLLSFLGINEFKEHYEKSAPITSADQFMDRVLAVYNVSYKIHASKQSKIPTTGPLIIACNHPFGGIEPVIIAQYIKTIRPDVKIMANYVLSQIKELEEICIMVDPFENKSSSARNFKPLREAKEWLSNEGVLIIFPAGAVSHYHPKEKEIIDPVWNKSVAKLALTSKADVIPFFIHGRNSLFFQLMGLIHPLLRTALLGREIINKKNKHIHIQHSHPISNSFLKQFGTAKSLTDYLRFRCYLQKNSIIGFNPIHKISTKTHRSRLSTEIVKKQNLKEIESELKQLHPSQSLLTKNELTCFYAKAEQIPTLLVEIGRLRELTFREIDEGTGNDCDIDKYDQYYDHLFLWDSEAKRVVGAYRLGQVDRILKTHGLNGLYSYSLFEFDEDLLNQLGTSLELGRSFIITDYQKTFWPLTLLWKGIGQYINLNPRYTHLFGTVSISSQFNPISRQIIEAYLFSKQHRHLMANKVSPRTTNKHYPFYGIDAKTLSELKENPNEISFLLNDIELNDITLPILIKEYIKMGGQFLGFNIDSKFNHVLDGLITVNLHKTSSLLLKRYLGKDGFELYCQCHSIHKSE